MNTGACPVPDWRTNYSDIILAIRITIYTLLPVLCSSTKIKAIPKQKSCYGGHPCYFLPQGNCCHRLQKYEEAERFLSIARDMAPGHVLPQYYLFRHYVETGQTHKALNSAHTIIHSKFKQEGSTALQVKHLVKEYLSKTKEGGERQ